MALIFSVSSSLVLINLGLGTIMLGWGLVTSCIINTPTNIKYIYAQLLNFYFVCPFKRPLEF